MKKDGGPAFPSHGSMGEVVHHGMSLRAYFAGQTIGGILQMELAVANVTGSIGAGMPERVARSCLELADAMIAELERT